MTPLPTLPSVPHAVKHISAKGNPEDFDVDCDMKFSATFIQVSFYDDSFYLLVEKASQTVQSDSFVLHQVIFVKNQSNHLKVVDYFDTPFIEKPLGTFKGRVRVSFKTHPGEQLLIVPHILCFYLFYKY